MASDSLNEMVRLPLAGLTVLDFSQFLAGPSAALRLADARRDHERAEAEKR